MHRDRVTKERFLKEMTSVNSGPSLALNPGEGCCRLGGGGGEFTDDSAGRADLML